MNLKKELESRGFIKDFSDPKLFELYEAGGQSFYFGVDPTADSLHLGHFTTIMASINLMKKRNKLIIIVGGATGMVGDPSGKEAERKFLDEPTLRHNEKAIHKQVDKVLKNLQDLSGYKLEFEIMNNYDFVKNMNVLEFFREVGKHLTVNQMIAKDTVKRRLDDPDKFISYTEFSYMTLQGYDFYRLFVDKGCKLQIGGSDQWGNLVTGIELIRKKEEKEAYALTFPLVTDAQGKKFGKSEGNALWLDNDKTTPYQIYQYFMNTADADVPRFLKMYTLLDLDEINDIVKKHEEAPEQRYGQKQLAMYVTQTLHGKKASKQAENISKMLFGKEDKIELLTQMDDDDLLATKKELGGLELYLPGDAQMQISGKWKEGIGKIKNLDGLKKVMPKDKPKEEQPEESRQHNRPNNILELMVASGLANSKSEAKKDVVAGAIYMNESKIDDINAMIENTDFVDKRFILLRKGKKNYRLITKQSMLDKGANIKSWGEKIPGKDSLGNVIGKFKK